MAGSLPTRLSPAHQRMLFEESCLSTSVAVERKYRTVASKAELAQLGFSKPQQRVPALVVPMYSPDGELVTHQIRSDTPRKSNKGKSIKYETPAGSPIRLDVHPELSARVKDASVPLWVTEGVKKADSLVSRGECVVALQGVWCWQKDGVPLQDWEDVRLWGRSVCVIFDSDVTTNPKVQTALEGLVGFLRSRGASDTIRPRFDAAGGDPNRALLLGDDEPFAIPGDIPRLERAVRQVDASLVVIDPIMAFLSGDMNSNRDQDVRRALTPLKRMAERTGAAVLLVRHLNKSQGGNPLYRGGGSIGIIGAARSGMVVGPHPDSEELRVLAGQKNNLSLPPRSLAYSIETAENGSARISYKGFSEATAAQLLRVPEDEEEKSALTETKEFLTSELSRTPVSAKAIKKSAREAEISERTLRRAKQILGVRSEKESHGSWTWSPKGTTPPTLATLAPLAMLSGQRARTPLTHRKRAKMAKRSKQATNEGAYTVFAAAWDATYATRDTRTGSSKAARHEAV
jgi:hypothetical protein